MQINLSGLMVDDQAKALKFYTKVLGFVKKNDIPMGEFSWLTVVAPGTELPELSLEPMAFEPARVFQKALYEAGIPATAFEVNDIQAEYERLEKAGVNFKKAPVAAGKVMHAAFDDTCGNWIQIYQTG